VKRNKAGREHRVLILRQVLKATSGMGWPIAGAIQHATQADLEG